jgi:hypothetical protein
LVVDLNLVPLTAEIDEEVEEGGLMIDFGDVGENALDDCLLELLAVLLVGEVDHDYAVVFVHLFVLAQRQRQQQLDDGFVRVKRMVELPKALDFINSFILY